MNIDRARLLIQKLSIDYAQPVFNPQKAHVLAHKTHVPVLPNKTAASASKARLFSAPYKFQGSSLRWGFSDRSHGASQHGVVVYGVGQALRTARGFEKPLQHTVGAHIDLWTFRYHRCVAAELLRVQPFMIHGFVSHNVAKTGSFDHLEALQPRIEAKPYSPESKRKRHIF